MIGKIALLAGAGIGYVLGARAGRERYEHLKQSATRTADKVRHDPRVQETAAHATEVAKERATSAAEAARSKVGSSESPDSSGSSGSSGSTRGTSGTNGTGSAGTGG